MRIISSLLVLLAILFVVRSAPTQVSLIRYCNPSTKCNENAQPAIQVNLNSCEAYTDKCQSMITGNVRVSSFEDSKTTFGIELFTGACTGEAITNVNITCGVCSNLEVSGIPNLGQYQVECPESSSSEPSSESSHGTSSSASTIIASTVVVLGSIIAALL